MPDDDMWNWITSPLVGVKAAKPGPGARTAGKAPASLTMRKAPTVDLTLHNDPGSSPQGKDQTDGGDSARRMPPVGSKESDNGGGEGGDNRTRDADRDEREKRAKQKEEAGKPNSERMKGAAKDLIMHYVTANMGPLKEKALDDLAKAWKESPGGVIAAAAILGSAGVAYLVGTKSNIPKIPAIPLDFLAGRAPVFKGAELNIEISGPITGPESLIVSVTFHERTGGDKPKSGAGRGKAFTPRLTLRQDGVKASGEESGDDLEIEGQVPIPSKAGPEDVAATISAIEDGRVEVDVGGSPVYQARVLSVTDNFVPDRYGLKAPPSIRFLTVRLKTAIPPIFHEGKDEVAQQSVSVRINRVSNEGEAKIRVHMQPLPTAGSESPKAKG